MGFFGPPNIDKMRAKRDVEGLVKALGYQKDANVRKAAVEALAEIGDTRAVEPLIAALNKSEDTVAAHALGKIGDVRAVEPLIAALSDSLEYMSRSLSVAASLAAAAAHALGQIGDARAVEVLITALKYSECGLKKEAAAALDKCGWRPGQDENAATYWIAKGEWDKCIEIGVPAVTPLIAARKDSHNDVRNAAVSALDRMGQPGQDALRATFLIENGEWDKCVGMGTPAVAPLIAALEDSDSAVRSAAAHALGQIGDARAVTPLIAALKDRDRQALEKTAGILVTAEVFDPRAGARFIAKAKRSEQGQASRDASKAAADALEQIRDARAIESLLKAYKEKLLSTSHFCDLIGKFTIPEATEPLIELLKYAIRENNELVRIRTIFTLIRIGEPVIEPLNGALDAALRRGEDTAFADGGALTILAKIAAKAKGAGTKTGARVGVGPPAVAPLGATLKDSDGARAEDALVTVSGPVAQEGPNRYQSSRFRCGSCDKVIEEIGVPPQISLAQMYRQVVNVGDESVPAEIKADPYLYRGLYCPSCEQVFCPTCAGMQAVNCPRCKRPGLMPGYRPLLRRIAT